MQIQEKNPSNKFVSLNFNLKNEIFSFLKIEEIINDIFLINKKFFYAISKQKLFITIKKEIKNTLKELDFSVNSINRVKKSFTLSEILEDKLIEEICSYYLKSKHSNNIQIDLSDTKYIKTDILSNFLFNNEKLNFLFLFENKLGKNKHDIQFLSMSLLDNTSLKELYISLNKIGRYTTDLIYISILLVLNQTLELIDFSYNKIGSNPEDCMYLSYGLKFNKKLKYFNLAGNKIGINQKDLKYFFEGLLVNSTIECIDLSFNHIENTEENANYIINILIKNPTLNMINLMKNPIGRNEKLLKYNQSFDTKKLII